MGVPGRYYAKENKSDIETQIPYDLAYTWNLKNKLNRKNEIKCTLKLKKESKGHILSLCDPLNIGHIVGTQYMFND